MNKSIILTICLLLFCSCNSIQKKLVGNWNLISIINNDDVYASRSSLTPQVVKSEMYISLRSDGTFISNGNLCTGNWKELKIITQKGNFICPNI